MARILLVEDELLVRQLISDDLADDGHAVSEASNGREAANRLGELAGLELLVTDIRMPGDIDGWALGRLAGAAMPQIAIIYITGYTDQIPPFGPRERLLKKPFRHEQLRDMIGELLG